MVDKSGIEVANQTEPGLTGQIDGLNFKILGVTNDSRREDWLKALEQDQLPWKQVIDEFPEPYKPARVITMYAAPYLPTLILIGPDGKIIGQAKDKHQLVEWLEERL